MIDTVKSVLHRQHATLWQDAIGVISLVVIFVGALHLPSVF